jgi:hypothetical protein
MRHFSFSVAVPSSCTFSQPELQPPPAQQDNERVKAQVNHDQKHSCLRKKYAGYWAKRLEELGSGGAMASNDGLWSKVA